MLVKALVFLVVFGLIVKLGLLLAVGYSGITAFQFASGIEGSRVVQVIVFVGAFAIFCYLAVYFLVFAALALGIRAAGSL